MQALQDQHPERRYAWTILGAHLASATVSRYERGLTGGRWESALALALALDLDSIDVFCLVPAEVAMLRQMWQTG